MLEKTEDTEMPSIPLQRLRGHVTKHSLETLALWPLDMGTWNATPHPPPTLHYLTLMTMTPIHHFPSVVLVLVCSKGCSWPVQPPSSRRRPRKNTAHCLYPAHRGQGQSAIWAQQTQKSHKHLSPISSDPAQSTSSLKVTSLPS